MIALEIETSILNHRIEIISDLLPENVLHAKIIVMYDENAISKKPQCTNKGALAGFRENPLKVTSFVPLSREEANAR